MNPVDLRKALKPYADGWVAIDKKNKTVVAHAKSFALLAKKIKETKDIFLMPVSKNYFGFITLLDA